MRRHLGCASIKSLREWGYTNFVVASKKPCATPRSYLQPLAAQGEKIRRRQAAAAPARNAR